MKVLIIGSVASGKTTFAKRLSLENSIDYYELDSIVHDDINNRKRNSLEQDKIISKINENNDWIIEGTLRDNLYYLLDYSDRIIYLDIFLCVRKRRIFIRFLKQVIGLEKCNYKPSFRILKMMYIWTYEFEKKRKYFESKINNYSYKLTCLRSLREVNNYKL